MNLLQLVLTLVLVAGGLFVYDTFVADRPDPATAEPLPIEAPVPDTDRPPGGELPLRVEQPAASYDELVTRIAALEARLGAAERGGGPGRSDPGTPGEGGFQAPAAFRAGDLTEGLDPRFDERDLAWFRAMKDEADRRQRQERFEEMISGQLDSTGVKLTGEQRDRVLEATLKYRASIRAKYREEGFSQRPAAEREETLKLLRADYEQSLYILVPSEEADKILDRMGSFPGMSGRRFGPGRTR